MPELLDDSPLDNQGLQRFSDYRLTPVYTELLSILRAWQAICPKPPKTLDWSDFLNGIWRKMKQSLQQSLPQGRPPCIGLFGSPGQGKSTIIHCVRETLEAEQRKGDESLTQVHRFLNKIIGPRIVLFDTSFYRHSDLEWRFFASLFLKRILVVFSIFIFIIIAISIPFILFLTIMGLCVGLHPFFTWLLSCLISIDHCLVWLLGIPWAGRFILGPLADWNILKMGDSLWQSSVGLFMQKLCYCLGVLPEIVIVDDLDRATPSQQQSFFRALTRYSRHLRFAVVVCMDEGTGIRVAESPEPVYPAEILRKVISRELRIPDPVRADVIAMGIACIREFCRQNNCAHEDTASPDTAGFLNHCHSAVFVADFLRVLFLGHTISSISPRLMRTFLNRIAILASELHVVQYDDLAALIRLEGLLLIAPNLRSSLDELRQALEANNSLNFKNFIIKHSLSIEEQTRLFHYCTRTRMMQPTLHDGWLRLLAGLEMQPPVSKDTDAAEDKSWYVPWKLKKRSRAYFVCFLEAFELTGYGYDHDLDWYKPPVLPVRDNQETITYRFPIAGGGKELFASSDLPTAFTTGDRSDYHAQRWVLCVTALAMAAPERKAALFERAFRWAQEIDASMGAEQRLIRLFWRECMADTDLWSADTPLMVRELWWQRAADAFTSGCPLRYFLTCALQPTDFLMACWFITYPGDTTRDTRKIFYWLRDLTPEVAYHAVDWPHSPHASIMNAYWPVPSPVRRDASHWFQCLQKHFAALTALDACIRHSSRIEPIPLHNAWLQAQEYIDARQCFELLHGLACDMSAPAGQRWAVNAVSIWLGFLEEPRKKELEQLICAEDLEFREKLTCEQRLTAVLLCILHDWTPEVPESLVKELPSNDYQNIRESLQRKISSLVWVK